MLSTDLVAELRAEVTRWWESLCRQRREQETAVSSASVGPVHHQATSTAAAAMMTPILGSMLVDGPLRLITLGQELSVDADEKTLAEMAFKDCQVNFISYTSSLIVKN